MNNENHGGAIGNEIKLAVTDDEDSLRQTMRRLNRQPVVGFAKASFEAVVDAVPSALRRATNRIRHLPTVVIVGVKRAGTRKLYGALLQHPRCFGAAEKEIDYFSSHSERSVSWYRSKFPLRRRVRRRSGHVIEVSPSYLPTPSAVRRMKAVLPGARVIVLLRDPVSRAFAHYQHDKERYVESRSFEEAVAAELRRNEFPAKRGVAMAPDARPMLGYVARGYYGLQLEHLLKVYPRNRVIFIDSESLYDDASAVCNRIFSFMGLDSCEIAPGKGDNRDSHREVIDPRVADRLREHYRPHDALLQEILGQPFSWMAPRAQAA